MIIAGDIGGTRARLALFERDGKTKVRQETYESHAYKSLEAVLKDFLGKKPPRVKVASFGIAGPVVNRKCVATNFPWVVDARKVERAFGWKHVALVNDLVALAMGAAIAPKKKLKPLIGAALPKKRGANIAILAAGTGLGAAVLVWDNDQFVAMATEGGHADFAPRTDIEAELASFLRGKHGRASVERVLSGPGLGHLYDFFHEAKGLKETDHVALALAEAPDRNAEITRMGLAHESAAAAAAVDLFTSIYGAEAGNLALRSMALGGVFIAGNIAIQLAEKLSATEFQTAFQSKEPMDALLKSVPVALVLDSTIGLAGAAHHAAQFFG